jgi:hypothetical protein
MLVSLKVTLVCVPRIYLVVEAVADSTCIQHTFIYRTLNTHNTKHTYTLMYVYRLQTYTSVYTTQIQEYINDILCRVYTCVYTLL